MRPRPYDIRMRENLMRLATGCTYFIERRSSDPEIREVPLEVPMVDLVDLSNQQVDAIGSNTFVEQLSSSCVRLDKSFEELFVSFAGQGLS